MSTIAFELREAYAGTVTQYATADDEKNGNGTEVPRFLGGVIAAGADSDIDVAEALEEGGGRIVLDEDADPRAITALDEYPPLKRVGSSEGDELTVPYSKRKADDLRKVLAVRGITGDANKDDLVTVLERHDELSDAGELPAELTVEGLLEADTPDPDNA
jgi:hypothetical protein